MGEGINKHSGRWSSRCPSAVPGASAAVNEILTAQGQDLFEVCVCVCVCAFRFCCNFKAFLVSPSLWSRECISSRDGKVESVVCSAGFYGQGRKQ